jgi:hypothetical protein
MLPWQFGKNCSGTSEEAIIQAGLNFHVEKVPLYIHEETEEGTTAIKIPEFATYRKDKQKRLGVMGKVYRVVQNVDSFKFLDSLVESSQLQYVKGGEINDGAQIYLVGKLPNATFTVQDQIHQSYVTLINGHDGKTSFCCYPSDVRGNSYYAFHALKIRHSGKTADQMKDGITLIQNATEIFERYGNKLAKMATVEISTPEFARIALQISAFHNKTDAEITTEEQVKYRYGTIKKDRGAHIDTVHNLVVCFQQENNEIPSLANTAYSAFNAVNRWANFKQKYKGSFQKRSETRFVHLLNGKMRKIQATALDYLVKKYGV